MAARTSPLAEFRKILRSRASAAKKATRIIELAPTLPEEALPVMDEFLDAADPLVQVAIMDAYFEMTGDDYHEEDLISIMNTAARRADGEELYLAARIALGRVLGDPHDAWQAPNIAIMGFRSRGRRPSISGRGRRQSRESITLLIHGTWASDEEWWQPGGDFFEYVKNDLLRSDLYGARDRFRWSGRNRGRDRRRAGTSLAGWLRAHPSAEVNVFAHSHGANVAMLSTWSGVAIDRLVMLSPPVREDYFADWNQVGQAFNIQSSFDPVVAIARGGKWFADRGIHFVSELELEANGHSVSHESEVWEDEGVADFVGIPW